MLGSCINVSQKNNLVIIKINENAKIQDIIPQIKKKVYQFGWKNEKHIEKNIRNNYNVNMCINKKKSGRKNEKNKFVK